MESRWPKVNLTLAHTHTHIPSFQFALCVGMKSTLHVCIHEIRKIIIMMRIKNESPEN